jgi:hypothetical protein
MSTEASAGASAGCCCDVPLCTFPQGQYRLRISCSASRICREAMLNGLQSETIETSSVDFIADMVGGNGFAASPLSASYTRSSLNRSRLPFRRPPDCHSCNEGWCIFSTSTADLIGVSDIEVGISCLSCEPNQALVRYGMFIDMRWIARITSITGTCDDPNGAPTYLFTQSNEWSTAQTQPGSLTGLGSQGVTYGGLPSFCNVQNLIGVCGSPPDINTTTCTGINYNGYSFSCTQNRCFEFICETFGGERIVECLCFDAIDAQGQINNGGMFEVTSSLAETSSITVELV